MQFFSSLLNILNPSILLVMIIGSIGGIIIGAMPGLTSVMGVTLLLPFTYGMDTTTGIAMLLAISFGAIYGGSVGEEDWPFKMEYFKDEGYVENLKKAGAFIAAELDRLNIN